MRSLITFLACVTLMVVAFSVGAQNQVYTSDKLEYSIELPSPVWKVVSDPDAVHDHTEFVYGDRLEGYLQIRKEAIDANITVSELGAPRSGSEAAVSARIRRGQRRKVRRTFERCDRLL